MCITKNKFKKISEKLGRILKNKIFLLATLLLSFLFCYFLFWPTEKHYREDIYKEQIPYSFLVVHHSPNTANAGGFNLLKRLIELSDHYKVKLTLLFNPQWVDMILENPEMKDLVHTWQKNGHEIGIEHHGPSHMQWNGYSNMENKEQAEGLSYLRDSGYAIHKFLGSVDEENGYIERARELTFPYEIKSGTITDKWTDFPRGIRYDLEGGIDGRTRKAISNIWNGEIKYRLNIESFCEPERFDTVLEHYKTLTEEDVFGIVVHSHNFPEIKESLEEWFKILSEQDLYGKKRETVSWIMENYIYPNNLITEGICGDSLCNDLEKQNRTCPRDCGKCAFSEKCSGCDSIENCPECKDMRLCEQGRDKIIHEVYFNDNQ